VSIFKPITQGFLFTDFYQITMAQVYYRQGIALQPAHFEYFFRSYPNYGSHQAGFCILAGLRTFFEWLVQAKPRPEDLAYLKSLTNRQGKPLFDLQFLDWLKEIDFSCLQIEAIAEGRVVHPHVPLVSVTGPLALAQLIETPLLNIFNYQTLVATKAARFKRAARSQVVMDFGLRRAQGLGGNAGTRAALIGGIDFSSNTGTCAALGVPAKGTHAHSLVQAFLALGYGEEDAFLAFAETFPDDCILLIDTINTLESGLPHAIKIFQRLRQKGHKPVGVRIDSGDLAFLAVECYQELKKAGFEDCFIVLSNQLDELLIHQIISQVEDEAKERNLDPNAILSRLVFGAGTRLITSAGSCSLDGVYKLTAIKKQNKWVPAIKISDSPSKILNPGHKKVYRLKDKRNKAMVDLLCLPEERPFDHFEFKVVHPLDLNVFRKLKREDVLEAEELHQLIQKENKIVYEFPDFDQIAHKREKDLAELDSGVKRLINPHVYHVSLSEQLATLKEKVLAEIQKSKIRF